MHYIFLVISQPQHQPMLIDITVWHAYPKQKMHYRQKKVTIVMLHNEYLSSNWEIMATLFQSLITYQQKYNVQI
jgi:hypothetical protein